MGAHSERGHYEIDSSRVKLCKKLGSGVFQATYRFALQKTQSVAVRMIRDNLSRDDFFQEARSMMKLHHPNLVQFIGVCSRGRLPMILMEYMPFNTLHSYLLTPRAKDEDPRILLDLCGQVCSAMSYLVMRHCIHRNLASRNCFIGARNIIKVGDVGRQRKSVVSRNTLVGDEREYFAWLSLETLEQSLFTHKSDVWAFGILMWEVFAFGEHPYGSLDCAAVTHFLQLGNRLDRPAKCPQNVFDMMQRCWDRNSGYRPTFEQLQEQLMDLKNDLVIEYKRPPRLPIYETHLN